MMIKHWKEIKWCWGISSEVGAEGGFGRVECDIQKQCISHYIFLVLVTFYLLRHDKNSLS